MIEINLLPDEFRKGRGAVKSKPAARKSASAGISPLVPLLFIILLGGACAAGYYVFIQPYMALKNKEDALIAKEKKVDDTLKKLNSDQELQHYKALEAEIEGRLRVLQSLDPDDRLLWAEKMNIISDLRIKDVYIERINISESVKEQETAASYEARAEWEKRRKKDGNKAGLEPKKVTLPIITQTMTIYGLVRPLDESEGNWATQAQDRLLEYVDDLKTHHAVQDASVQFQRMDFMSNIARFEAGGQMMNAQKEVGEHKVLGFEVKVITKPILKYDEKDLAGTTGDE